MDTQEATVVPKYAIVCDDIRREDNGKQILIGIYTGDIIVSAFPTNLNLSFWLHLAVEKPGIAKVEVQMLLGPGETQIFRAQSSLETKEPDPFTVLAFGGIGLAATHEGYISLQWRQVGDDWQEINRTRIRTADDKITQ